MWFLKLQELPGNEKNGNIHTDEVSSKKPLEEQIPTNQQNSYNASNCNKSDLNISNNYEIEEEKKFTVETIIKTPDSPNVTEEQKPIPKLIIRLKPETKVTEPEIPAEISQPLTIADNVKLGRRRNGNLKPSNSEHHSPKSDDGTYRKKSRHKKRQNNIEGTNKQIPDVNQNFKSKSPVEFTNEKVSQVKKISANGETSVSKTYSMMNTENDLKPQLSNSNSFLEDAPSITTFYSCNNEYNNDLKYNSVEKENNQSSVKTNSDYSFVFDFKETSISPLPSSDDNQKELNNSVDDIFDDFEINFDGESIPDSSGSLIDDMQSSKIMESSKENSFSSMTDQGDISSPAGNEFSINGSYY